MRYNIQQSVSLHQVRVFVVAANDAGENAADILVIDDELHDVDTVTQSAVTQSDAYSGNRMLVLPDRVSLCSLQSGCCLDSFINQ